MYTRGKNQALVLFAGLDVNSHTGPTVKPIYSDTCGS